jgi:hypothetical protein
VDRERCVDARTAVLKIDCDRVLKKTIKSHKPTLKNVTGLTTTIDVAQSSGMQFEQCSVRRRNTAVSFDGIAQRTAELRHDTMRTSIDGDLCLGVHNGCESFVYVCCLHVDYLHRDNMNLWRLINIVVGSQRAIDLGWRNFARSTPKNTRHTTTTYTNKKL